MSDTELSSLAKKNLFVCWKEEEVVEKSNKNEECPEFLKKKKRIRLINPHIKQGRWDDEEHRRFLKACFDYGEDWPKIEAAIKTRNTAQIRSHAQKYLIKLCKKYAIKLNKKKFKNRKSTHLEWNEKDEKSKKLDISQMSEYDKNILKMFRYYDRDYSKVVRDAIDSESSGGSELKDDMSPVSRNFNYKKFVKLGESKTEVMGSDSTVILSAKEKKETSQSQDSPPESVNSPKLQKLQNAQLNTQLTPQFTFLPPSTQQLFSSQQNFLEKLSKLHLTNQQVINSLQTSFVSQNYLAEIHSTREKLNSLITSFIAGVPSQSLYLTHLQGLGFLDNLIHRFNKVSDFCKQALDQEIINYLVSNKNFLLGYMNH